MTVFTFSYTYFVSPFDVWKFSVLKRIETQKNNEASSIRVIWKEWHKANIFDVFHALCFPFAFHSHSFRYVTRSLRLRSLNFHNENVLFLCCFNLRTLWSEENLFLSERIHSQKFCFFHDDIAFSSQCIISPSFCIISQNFPSLTFNEITKLKE